MLDKLVSVIIPVYNHALYIEACIESIWKQECKNVEIIAYDDGSTDQSYDELLKLKSRSPLPMFVFTKENEGSCKTVNRALKLANGHYVMIIASDDFYEIDAFCKLFAFLEKNSTCPLVYSNGYYFEKKMTSTLIHDGKIKEMLIKPSVYLLDYITKFVPRPLLVQSCIIEKSLLNAIGGLDEDAIIDDWALNIKMLSYLIGNSKTHLFYDFHLLNYRLHASNFHSNSQKMIKGIDQIANRYIMDDKRRNRLLSREFFYYGLFSLKILRLKYAFQLLIKACRCYITYFKCSITPKWI